jgi:hypothetical protein
MWFSCFFQKCINASLSNENLHIMPIVGHFSKFQIFCQLFTILLFHVLYDIIGSKQCKALAGGLISLLIDNEPSNAAIPIGLTTPPAAGSQPNDAQKLHYAVVTSL